MSSTLLPRELAAIVRDPMHAVSQRGERPVVAFMSNNVPIELIHAAGCFPLQLPTSPRASTARADHYLEPRFDPMVRSALEQLLSGDFEFLELLVLPRSVDSMQRLYYYLCELRRSFAERLPEPFLYDLLHTPWYSSAEYNFARTAALQLRLSQLAGRAIDDAALAASIQLYNRVRTRIEQLVARRRAVPCTLSGETALALYAAAQRALPETLCSLLDQVLEAAPEPAQGIRTLLVGSAHDTPALHRLIAEAGGQVVADEHWLGEPLFGAAIDEQLPPLRAISSHYHRDSTSVRTFPADGERLLTLAREARAEAVIFFFYAEEEALTWDYPAQQRALSAAGLPVLQLARQPYPPSIEILHILRGFFEGVVPNAERRPEHV